MASKQSNEALAEELPNTPFRCENCGDEPMAQAVKDNGGQCAKCGDCVTAYTVDTAEYILALTARLTQPPAANGLLGLLQEAVDLHIGEECAKHDNGCCCFACQWLEQAQEALTAPAASEAVQGEAFGAELGEVPFGMLKEQRDLFRTAVRGIPHYRRDDVAYAIGFCARWFGLYGKGTSICDVAKGVTGVMAQKRDALAAPQPAAPANLRADEARAGPFNCPPLCGECKTMHAVEDECPPAPDSAEPAEVPMPKDTPDAFQREDRYIVLKRSDVDVALDTMNRTRLDVCCKVVAHHREQRGAPPLECVVVESDWPEYEPTWAAIEARMRGAAPEPAEAMKWHWRDCCDCTFSELFETLASCRVCFDDPARPHWSRKPEPALDIADLLAEAQRERACGCEAFAQVSGFGVENTHGTQCNYMLVALTKSGRVMLSRGDREWADVSPRAQQLAAQPKEYGDDN